jgi:RNA polymerase sigma-70 factor (ECF subfamily)
MDELSEYTDYLLLLANWQLRRMNESGIDPMDLVQETFARAQQHEDQYRGSDRRAMAGWLRSILINYLRDTMRRLGREADEQKLKSQMEQSSIRLENWLVCGELTPRRKSVHNETILLLSSAMLGLPSDQRIAVELRYLHGYSIEQICAEMQRSPASVGGLLQRGLSQLRKILGDQDSSK